MQSCPVNTDTEGAIECVHLYLWSVVLRGLNLEKIRGLSLARNKANCP